MFLRKMVKKACHLINTKKREREDSKRRTYLRFPLCKHTVIVWILNINQCFVRQESRLSSNTSFHLKIRRRRLSRNAFPHEKHSNTNLPYPSISSEALQFLESSLSHSSLSKYVISLFSPSFTFGYVLK